MVPLPKLDERTAREICREVRSLLPSAQWPEHEGGFDSALINVFARFGELIINRLNQAPEKNLLAFLDLLGVSQLPMQAARVPLTFSMAPGSATCAKVPAGTQVAAPPGPGQQKPIIFETERDLVVTTARLDSLFTKFGARDQYRDLSSTLLLPSDVPTNVQPAVTADAAALPPAGVSSIPHVLYFAVPVSASWPHIDQLRVKFVLAESAIPMVDSRSLQWELRLPDPAPPAGASNKLVLIPSEDTTKNLTQSGDIVFLNLPQTPPVAIEGISGRWLCCRLLTRISPSTQPVADMVRASQLPKVSAITAEMQLARTGLALEQAFYNSLKLDLTKDFFPFGERPKFGDTLYLANKEAFSNPDDNITLQVQLTNSESAGSDVGIPNTTIHNTQLSWEFWNGQEWTKLGKSRFLRLGDAVGDTSVPEFADETNSLSADGNVTFRFSSPPAELNLNGQKNYWIRVRIAAGNYGEESQFQRDPSTGALVAKPATLAPPSIRSIKLGYVVQKQAQPSAVLTCNDFVYAQENSQIPFKPFIPIAADDASPSIHFGFAVDPPLAANRPANPGVPAPVEGRQGKFPNQPVSAYVVIAGDCSQKSGDLADTLGVATWEYWDGVAWRKCSVRDETQNLRRTGLIQFLPPNDFVVKKEFGRERYWLRMRSNANRFDPTIRNIYLNTATAIQGSSIVNDILGSSNGKATQKFQTTQVSVLPGQKLEVREPTMLPLNERKTIEDDEGDGAIQPFTEPNGRTHYWVTWHEVANFYGSGPRDRHYVLDHVKGELSFGDGICGLIPPVLPGNIRMTRYRSGGGVSGNQPAQAIAKLNSAVPYIQKVVNWIPASGGTDPEENAMLLERGPRGVRHGGRAVTFEDFEDLAMLASREVARVKCVPLYDLSLAPGAKRLRPGLVSLIIVPRSADPRPLPDSDLLDRVRTFLDDGRLPAVEIVLTGPEYVRVDVDAEIVVDNLGDASDVERTVREKLDLYLHPVTGGPDGCGWDFGRLPQKFDLCGLIEQIPGVNHIRDLRVIAVADRPGGEKTGHFLICCGQYKIALTLEEQSAVELA